MSGVTAKITTQGLQAAIAKVALLEHFRQAELVDGVGALMESSTRRRLDSEKTTPEGDAWADWSEAYAQTRGGHHSLLVSEGDLLDSVQNQSGGSEAIVGSNLVYAARRQFGGGELGFADQGRAFLGLSAEDERDITDLVTSFTVETLQ